MAEQVRRRSHGTYTLSPLAHAIVEAISEELGVSRSACVEQMLRREMKSMSLDRDELDRRAEEIGAKLGRRNAEIEGKKARAASSRLPRPSKPAAAAGQVAVLHHKPARKQRQKKTAAAKRKR